MSKQMKSENTHNSAKEKAVQHAIDEIKDRFGDGSIMKLGEVRIQQIDSISTGSISLDIALGIGGVPRGRVIEIFGPESSGKTTLTQHIIANVQKKGGLAAFVDAEHALDPDYAKKIGVNINDLLISQPETGEQALEIVETLVRSNAVDVVVIDSVAALTPRAEIEGDMGDSHMGLQARLMSQALRKLTAAIYKSKTCVIFLNQIRMKIGIMFGNPETTTGGMALKFYSSVRLDIRRTEQLKKGDDVYGNRVRVKVVKNKVAPPFKVAEFELLYGEGISPEGEIIDLGVKYNLINKAGAWLTLEDAKSLKEENDKLGQGRDAAKAYLKENPKLAEKLTKEIRAKAAQPAED